MVKHQIFALILDYEIKEIQTYPTHGIASQMAIEKYGSNAFSIDCSYSNVEVGDKFIDGFFYKSENGFDIKQEESYEDKVLQMRSLAQSLDSSVEQLIISSLTK